jgi:hypothetical protein
VKKEQHRRDKLGKKNQNTTRNNIEGTNYKKKNNQNTSSINKSDNLSLVQRPSTVTCMITTSPLTSAAPYSDYMGKCTH